MAKIQPVWAIDIGQAALKALKLVPGTDAEKVTAEAFDFIEYPKILSQPDADPEQLVREALETFLERNDLKGCKVAIAVPGQAGLVKFIKLPPVEKKRIPDIVKFEARQQIPFALEEVVWAYQQIGDTDADGGEEDFTMAEVGLFAMKRDQINRAILPLKAAGIEVDVVQMGPIALYNFISFDKIKGSDSKDSVVVLDIGADNTDLIITDGSRIWQRNVPIGGNHFTRALTKELKLTFAKAEHLKRNATKAPDPRSIFTAMRGVFNDFASEVNRSIGFYSSVNRTSKISKIVGMGNGFKLPGLQKFLQQNLSHEVEKLEGFARLTGDEVVTQPVFQDNLMSFAVAYGLATQGLGKSGLRTNLLPPEIEQVRLIRAKKPWALAAASLLMVGCAGLFLGDYRVLAKVSSPGFKSAVEEADRVTTTGKKYQSDYDTAVGSWNGENDIGKAIVGDAADRGQWPSFLKTLSLYLPDPYRDYKLSRDKNDDQPRVDRLMVHIDAIKPVWRDDLAAGWFNLPAPEGPDDRGKAFMIPYDRDPAHAPSGEGWVIQVIGHHYNPYPSPAEDKMSLSDPKRTEFGPYGYLVRRIIPALNDPRFRLEGAHHVALAWMDIDKAWTTEKGAASNNIASNTVPLLAKASPPATDAAGGGAGMPGGGALPGGGMLGREGGGGGRAQAGMVGPAMGAMPGGGMLGGMRGGQAGAADAAKITTLTRTDFLITFAWTPPKPEERLKPGSEEYATKLKDERTKLTEAEKNSEVKLLPVPSETDLQRASIQQSATREKEIEKAQQAAVANPGGAQPAGAAPPAKAAAPAAGATPPAGDASKK